MVRKSAFKAIFGVALAALVAAASFAQQGFTIRRPAEGSVVREVVSVRIPARSIPPGGYVGIIVNGKFLEAVAVTPEDIVGDDFVYKLNTKERQIADGPLKLEAALYASFGDASRAIGKSEVNCRLANKDIKPPEGGFRLRYNFTPRRRYTYKLTLRSSTSVMTQAQAQLGGRAPELPQGSQSARFMYEIDNKYAGSNGHAEGLIHMQVLPPNGRKSVMLTLANSTQPEEIVEGQFSTVYMRITDTGREVFGRMPLYIYPEGSTSQGYSKYVYGIFPLPVLPADGVQVGDSWGGGITSGALRNNADLHTTAKVSSIEAARGTLESVEWEGGQRCAKITNTVASGKAAANGNQEEITEEYWFSLDYGFITKYQKTFTTTIIEKTAAGGGGGNGTGGSEDLPPGGKRRPGAAGTSSFNGPSGSIDQAPPTGGPDAPGAPGGARGRRGGRGGGNGFGGGNGRGRGGNQPRSTTRILKNRTQYVMTLE